MILVHDTKPWFQKRLRPATRWLAQAGVTANQVTMITMAVSLAAGAGVAFNPGNPALLLVIPAALLVRLACNHIDGLLAREHGLKTPLGAILNELADPVADCALYLPLALVPAVPAPLVVSAVFLGVLTEMSGVAALKVDASRREDGPMSKKPRGVFFSGVVFALALGAGPGPWLDGALGVVNVLLVITVVNRIRAALRERVGPC